MARTTIKLPKGQAAHVLRHTFASHFIQNGGNIVTLQRILGHSSLVMTMRYAHLAPDHLRIR
ncbi:tyrosine-type recombinase/integrase [Phytopseudomonas daroniae]|uniref:tyrosine-type recombinase/integrase n=1 Tax=Pseudomonadaceae TaxID=135621 RepID=UPI0024182997|nr:MULTISPECIES: tyrosine-type recombinase/integrase [Pseudomonas]